MNKYHSFNVAVASECGVACALVLGHIDFLVEKARANGVNKYRGKHWISKSMKSIADEYPYYTEKQVRHAINILREKKLIETDHFPTKETPSTLWYTVTKKGKKLLISGSDTTPPMANQSDPEGETSTKVLDTVLDTVLDEVVEGGGSSNTIENPFGDAATAAAPVLDPLVAYAQNNLMHLGPYNMDELISFRDALPDELIQHAIDEACAAGVRRYKYVKSILNRYVEQGFKSVAEVEAYEAQRKKQKGGTNGGNNRSDLPAAPQRIAGETIV